MKAIKVTAAAAALALTASVATAGGPTTPVTPQVIVPAPSTSSAGNAPVILGLAAAAILAVALSSR